MAGPRSPDRGAPDPEHGPGPAGAADPAGPTGGSSAEGGAPDDRVPPPAGPGSSGGAPPPEGGPEGGGEAAGPGGTPTDAAAFGVPDAEDLAALADLVAADPGPEADELLEAPAPSERTVRAVLTRVGALVLTAVCLYLLFPSILQVFSSFDELSQISLWWFPLILALQAASFTCVWALQRLALRTRRWFAVATSQLAGNAFSRIVPGGAAAGVALQYKMLGEAGVPTTQAASSLTAVSLLTTGVTLSLPVLSLPAILGGTPVDDGLVRAAWLGAVVFVVMVGLGAVLLFSTKPLVLLGELTQRIGNRVLRRDPPTRDLPQRLLEERALVRDTLQSRWWEALLFGVGRSLLDYLSLLAALLAVGADPDPSIVLLAYVASQVLAMIPITPGGLGFVEAGLTATLALAGVPGALAVVATLAYRLASYWIPLVAGGIAGVLFRQHYRREGGGGAGPLGADAAT